jgi:hypothetical protein
MRCVTSVPNGQRRPSIPSIPSLRRRALHARVLVFIPESADYNALSDARNQVARQQTDLDMRLPASVIQKGASTSGAGEELCNTCV